MGFPLRFFSKLSNSVDRMAPIARTDEAHSALGLVGQTSFHIHFSDAGGSFKCKGSARSKNNSHSNDPQKYWTCTITATVISNDYCHPLTIGSWLSAHIN